MATLEQIEAALRKADAAGNSEDARRLAAAYREMRAAQSTSTDAPVATGGKPQLPEQFADLPVPGYAGAPEPSAPQSGGDFNETPFAQFTSGVNEGIATVAGAPVDLTNLALRAGAAGLNAATGSDIQLPVDAVGGRKTFTDIMAPTIRPESDNAGNRVLRRVGEEVGAALVPGMGVVAKSSAPLRTAAGQLATAVGSGAAAGAVGEITDNPYAEMAAQILGGGLVVGAAKAGQRAITPFPTSPERQAANAVLEREGVDLTAGQKTGNKTLRYAESELGGQRLSDLSEKQLEQFTQAALSRAGISANRATASTMDDAFNSIGKQFDDLAARNTLAADQVLGTELGAVVRDYYSLVPESQRAPIVESTLRDLVQSIRDNQGQISGEAYKTLRSRLNAKARKATDPELSDALFGIQRSLDDAMERSIQASNPNDLGAWQQVRSDYRNLLVIENAVGRAGETAAGGLITPANLRNAVQQQSKRAYVRGQGDFAELARAGAMSMSPLADSGTASRLAVRGVTGGIPSALGALSGNQVAGAPGAIAGMVAGAAVPNALGGLMLSPVGRRYLSNNALTGNLRAGEMIAGPALGGMLNSGGNALRMIGLN